MVFKPLYAFAVVLVNVLAVVVTSSARSTGLVRLTDRRDELDRPVYLWTISQDEQERLSTLLDADFYDAGVEGTYVTAPPQVCPHCGKETEFLDWVYTALERGVHSPGFIFDSLKAGRTPKGVHHDVYCAGCGHLTHVRDHTGNEGGALHISHATPYDRATKTFGKREPASEAADVSVDEPTTAEAPEKVAYWGTLGSWVSKREETAESDDGELEALAKAVSESGDNTAGWPAGGNFRWVLKREEEAASEPAVKPVSETGDNTAGWPAGGNFRWVLKREEEASAVEAVPETPGWFTVKWLRKRDEDASSEAAVEAVSEPIGDTTAGWPAGGNFRWVLKRGEEASAVERDEEASSVAAGEPVSETGDNTAGWPAGGNFRWVLKRGEEAASETAVEPVSETGDSTAAWPAGGNFRWVLKRI